MTDRTAPSFGGIGVGITRPGNGPGRLGALLESAGARVIHWPCIRFDPPRDDDRLRSAAADVSAYDWLVLTSPRAARRWLAEWQQNSAGDRRTTPEAAMRTAVVGPATGRVLRDAGWRIDRVPDVHSAAGLLTCFDAAGDVEGTRMLIPSSDLAGDELPDGLRAMGARVEQVTAYLTVPTPPAADDVRRAVCDDRLRVVTFTSPSTVRGFLAGVDPTLRGELAAAAIGSTTADALAAVGWEPEVASSASLESLVEAAARAAARAVAPRGDVP